jgi:hypothetical protein
MDPVKIFTFVEAGVTHALTEEMLPNIFILIEDEKGDIQHVALSEEGILALRYPDGKWETVEIKNNLNRGDDLIVEASLHKSNKQTGEYEYQSWRSMDAFAARAIKSWTFQPADEFPISESGIGSLPPKVGQLLVATVWNRCKGEAVSFREVVRRAVS